MFKFKRKKDLRHKNKIFTFEKMIWSKMHQINIHSACNNNDFNLRVGLLPPLTITDNLLNPQIHKVYSILLSQIKESITFCLLWLIVKPWSSIFYDNREVFELKKQKDIIIVRDNIFFTCSLNILIIFFTK